MAAPKVKEPKKPYTYRAKPSLKRKAGKKAKENGRTLSLEIETFLYDYVSR